MGVIDGRDALGWIEVCSIFGSLFAFGSIGVHSMLSALNVKEIGWVLYTYA